MLALRGGEQLAVGRARAWRCPRPGGASSSVGAGSCSLRQPLAQQHQQVGAVARRLGQGDLERRRLRRAVAAASASRGASAAESGARTHAAPPARRSAARAAPPRRAAPARCVSARANSSSRLSNDGGRTIGSRGSGRRPKARVELDQQASPKRRASPARGRPSRSSSCAQAHALQAPPSARGPGRAARPAPPASALPGRGEVGAVRRRLDAGEDRRALRRRRAGGVHDDGRAGASAAPQRLQQPLEAAEIAQARLHLEQHRVGRGARLAAPAATRRCGVNASAACATGSKVRASRAGSAWPRTMLRRQRERGRALQPRLDAERLRRGIGADDAMRVEQGDRPLGAALARARRAGSPRTTRARATAGAGRSRARRSRREASSEAVAATAIAKRNEQDAQARLTKVGLVQAARRRLAARSARGAAPPPRAPAASASCKRRFERRAAPLEDAQPQPIGAAGLQRQAQRRGRRPRRRRQLAHHEGGAVVVVGGELQAAQALGAQPRRQPGEHRADMAALQRLLERPQAVAARELTRGPGVDDEQLLDVEAEPGERRGRQMRPAGRRSSPAARRAAPRPAAARAGGSRRRRDAAAAARSAPGAASRRRAARRRARRSRSPPRRAALRPSWWPSQSAGCRVSGRADADRARPARRPRARSAGSGGHRRSEAVRQREQARHPFE